MISIRIVLTTTIQCTGHLLALWKCAHSLSLLTEVFFYIHVFFPLGRTVILEVKGLLIACLLPADRSTENLEARRIRRSVECCYLSSNRWQLLFTSALNIRPISRPAVTEVKIREDKGRGEYGVRKWSNLSLSLSAFVDEKSTTGAHRKSGKHHLLKPDICIKTKIICCQQNVQWLLSPGCW